LAGTIRADEWRGALRAQLFIEDAAPVYETVAA
jgi:hypothetical protein